ncbi:MAG: outer membrane beta-barrel protein [Pseudomonadota bacterium]
MKKYLFYFLPILLISSGLYQDTRADINYIGNDPGVYIDLGIGTIVAHSDLLIENSSATGGLSAIGQLGYQINRFLAVETGVQHYWINGNSGSIIPIVIKGMLPLGDSARFKLFGKLGGGILLNTAKRGTQPFAGLGASYAVTSKLDVAAEYQGVVFTNIFGSSSGHISTLSANLIYHFGNANQ